MTNYARLLNEAKITDWIKPGKEFDRINAWAKEAENVIENYNNKKQINVSDIKRLIREHDNEIDSWKSKAWFKTIYKKLDIANLYKKLKDIELKLNKKYNNSNSDRKYKVDVDSISYEKARSILCNDIKKACANCNKDQDIKKLLLDGLEKMCKLYDYTENDKEYKDILKYINSNSFFQFSDGGDYFEVCKANYQSFIISCHPQYFVGDELEKISSFKIDSIDYGDGDEGCLYIYPYN